jgi:tRNA(His) 5'-end guanylyltransferase
LDTPYQINEEYYPLPTFDARAFNIPENDVANYFLWRAKDNYRNSIQSFAQAHFSHKQLHGKSLSDIHEMLHDKGLNWATDCTPREKNGCWYSRQGGFNTGVRSSYVSVSTYLDRVVVYEVEKKEKRSLPF